MSNLFNLPRLFFNSLVCQWPKQWPIKMGNNVRSLSDGNSGKFSKYDRKLFAEMNERFEKEKEYADVYLENYSSLYTVSNGHESDSTKAQISRVIDIYDTLKYDLQKVPLDITPESMTQLIKLSSRSDLERQFVKLYNKEYNHFMKTELRKASRRDHQEEESLKVRKNGLFDDDNQLMYGLWRNALFTRMNRVAKGRFQIDRHRNAQLFGQNLVIDMSFSSHLSPHMSSKTSDDLGRLLTHNSELSEPFKVTLCGVDYDSHLWKALAESFPKAVDNVEHSSVPYLDQFPEDPVYITGMGRAPGSLEFNPLTTYVMAGVFEKDVPQDYISPVLIKQNVRRVCIPIDQHIIWQQGSKRLSLLTRLKLLADIRANVTWKEAFARHLVEQNFKPAEMIKKEEDHRLEKEAKAKQNREKECQKSAQKTEKDC